MSRVLVISPHPDDESIGCGGTVRKHAVAGDLIHAIFLTSGERGGHTIPPEETGPIRELEAAAACERLGIGAHEFWRQPDGAFRATKKLVRRLSDYLEVFSPDLLYVTHPKEAHPDHRQAALLVRSAMKLRPADKPKLSVLMYEVWTPLQHMSHIVDISPFIEDKLAAIRLHRSQCAVLKFDESALGLARYRGEMHSWPGGDYAEVFQSLDGFS